MRGGAEAARRAHNPKVGGSNPPPATNKIEGLEGIALLNPFFMAFLVTVCQPITW